MTLSNSNPRSFWPLVFRAALGIICVLLLAPGLLSGAARAATTQATPRSATYTNGSLVRDPNGAVFLVWNNVRHWIKNPATLDELGYGSSPQTALSWTATNAIPYAGEAGSLSLIQVAGGLVWPWAPIRTAPVILYFNRPSVNPGQIIHMSGSGFRANEQVIITAPGTTFAANADAQGALSVDVPIGFGVGLGLHHVFVLGSSSGIFSVQVFHVIAPSSVVPTVTSASPTVPMGGAVTVAGSGFAAGEQVRLFAGNGWVTGVATASSTGTYGPVSIVLNTSFHPGSTYNLNAYGASSFRLATTSFMVEAAPSATPTVTPTPTPTAIPTPVLAPVLHLSSGTVAVGGQTVISGSGFRPQETVLVYFNGQLQSGPAADTTGAFSADILTIPANFPPGTYNVVARGATSGAEASVSLVVQAATPTITAGISASPGQVTAGSGVSVSGAGFLGGEQVRISFNNALVLVITTRADGSFVNAAFAISRSAPPGRYGISATGAASGRLATTVVTVVAPPMVAGVYANPGTARPGQTLTIGGSGWDAGEIVVVRLDGSLIMAPTANAAGAFSGRYTVNVGVGRHTITAVGGKSGRSAAVSLTVARPVQVGIGASPNRVVRGSSLHVSGTNFQANEFVLVKFRGSLVGAGQADRSGRVSNVTFTVPGNTPLGTAEVTITGARSGRSARAFVYVLAVPRARPGLSLSPGSTHRGGRVYVSGHGFKDREVVVVSFHGSTVLALIADRHGDFNHVGFTVAHNVPYGTAKVTATGTASGISASTSLRVTAPPPSPSVSVSPRSIDRGGDVTVSGKDYFGGEIVLIRVDGRFVATPTADRHGTFKVRFHLPGWVKVGKHTAQSVGTKSGRTARASFEVTK
ncbi:MAG TPA: hypothetical protein VN837_13055 [Chloroflexota bacterium]|nr:hypothetical protein [Chloroflexota bacterium]